MNGANRPIPARPGELEHSDDAAGPPWSDRHYLYPHTFQPAEQRPGSGAWAGAGAWPAGELLGPAPLSRHNQTSVQAVIGDELRMPAVWCELGSCISRFSDAAALGESDVRSRALAADWRQDALGRLACPSCVQRDPTFWISYPVVPRPAEDVPPARALRTEQCSEVAQAPDMTWISRPGLQLAMTKDVEPRSARLRKRKSGRHRLTT